MRFGVGLFSLQCTAMQPRHWAGAYRDMRELARLLEDLGYDELWLSEHHFFYDGYCPALLPAAASVLKLPDDVFAPIPGDDATDIVIIGPSRAAVVRLHVTINGKGINVINSPGQSQSVTIALAPGAYPFVCTFHAALGMMGVLTVTG